MTNPDLYNDILTLSREIKLLIELKNFEKIEDILNKRQILINKISSDESKTEEIKKIIDEIKAIDEENFAELINNKDEVYSKLKLLSKNMQVLSLYKIKDSNTNIFIDEKN